MTKTTSRLLAMVRRKMDKISSIENAACGDNGEWEKSRNVRKEMLQVIAATVDELAKKVGAE